MMSSSRGGLLSYLLQVLCGTRRWTFGRPKPEDPLRRATLAEFPDRSWWVPVRDPKPLRRLGPVPNYAHDADLLPCNSLNCRTVSCPSSRARQVSDSEQGRRSLMVRLPGQKDEKDE
jgi:hypothetical protein